MKNLNFKRYKFGEVFSPETAERDTIHLVPVSTNPLTVKAYDVDTFGNVAEIKFDEWDANKELIIGEIEKFSKSVPSLYTDDEEIPANTIIKKTDFVNGIDVNYKKADHIRSIPLTLSDVDGIMIIEQDNEVYVRQFENSVNVQWFGAKGDGVADDTLSFQKAVDFLTKIKGGTILIPAGKYRISHVDFLGKNCSNITISGYGADIIPIYTTKTVIEGYDLPTYSRNNSSDGCFFFNAEINNEEDDNNTIKNILIEGVRFISDIVTYGFDELSHHISAYGVSGFTVNNCQFVGFLGDGIAINRGDGTYGGTYNKNFFCSNSVFDGVNKDNRQGISIYHCDNWKIDKCTFKNITRTGMPAAIDIEADSSAVISKNGEISNCDFQNIGGIAAVVFIVNSYSPTGPISFSNWKVNNCSFKDCSAALAALGNADFLTAPVYDSIIFENNTVEDCTVISKIQQASGIVFRSNYVKNCPSGMMVYDGVNGMKIFDNLFQNITHPDGLVFSGTCKNIDFIGNRFSGMVGKCFTINTGNGIGKIIDNDFGTAAAAVPIFVLGVIADASQIPRHEFKGNKSSGYVYATVYDFMISDTPNTTNLLPKHIINDLNYTASVIFLGAGYPSEIFNNKTDDNTFQIAVHPEKTFIRRALTPTTWSEFYDMQSGETQTIRKIGTTAQRPPADFVVTGTSYYDTTLSKILFSSNETNQWKDASGTVV